MSSIQEKFEECLLEVSIDELRYLIKALVYRNYEGLKNSGLSEKGEELIVMSLLTMFTTANKISKQDSKRRL